MKLRPLAAAPAFALMFVLAACAGALEAPVAHATPSTTLIDRELFRFADIWAAAGHPNAVFRLAPRDLVALTGAPVADVVEVVVTQ